MIVPWIGIADVLDTAFEQIRHYAASDVAVNREAFEARWRKDIHPVFGRLTCWQDLTPDLVNLDNNAKVSFGSKHQHAKASNRIGGQTQLGIPGRNDQNLQQSRSAVVAFARISAVALPSAVGRRCVSTERLSERDLTIYRHG